MLNKTEILGKFHNEKIVIGYDLGNEFSQISYLGINSEAPETLETVAGAETYNIPTVLCKRKEVGQWFYGKEAVAQAQTGEGILVDDLLVTAKVGEPVTVEGEEYDPVALLALFIKRSFALLSMVSSLDLVESVMFTCDNLDTRLVEVLSQAVSGLGLKTKKVYFQSHIESFYNYTIFQPTDLWIHQVVVCEYQRKDLKMFRMECNHRTTPIVAFIEERVFPGMPEGPLDEKDNRFLDILRQEFKDRFISCVYLIGDGFKGDWTKESLRFLCQNRRVFQGNNLYSKGACYAGREKQAPSEIGQTHVFLGNEKLKANIGMKVLRRGVDSYFALLDAGINWYEAKKECEFILESGTTFEILVTPLNGKEAKIIELFLDGLTQRPDKTTRVHMNLYLASENQVQVEVTDLGFGELFPSSGKVWKEEFAIS